MTTVIASAKLGMMASDSKFTEDGIQFATQKVYRIGDSLWGEAGETRGIGKFFSWVKGGMQENNRPRFGGELDDFCVLQLNAEGIFYWDRHLYGVKIQEDVYAIGTGAPLALYCVKEQGMSLEQAIKMATKYDENSALPVQSMALLPKT